MSGNVYPTLRGLAWPVVRHTLWNTITSDSLSMRTATLQLQQYALYQWELMYDVIRDDVTPSEYKALLGLFMAVGGRADTFLFTDPIYNTVTNEPFGVGDAVTQSFQVVATFHNTGGPGRADVIQNFNGLPAISVNGVLKTQGVDYSLGPQGLVTFVSPPAANAAITWTGSFYFRCRFSDDTLELSDFSVGWYETINPIKFGSVLVA